MEFEAYDRYEKITFKVRFDDRCLPPSLSPIPSPPRPQRWPSSKRMTAFPIDALELLMMTLIISSCFTWMVHGPNTPIGVRIIVAIGGRWPGIITIPCILHGKTRTKEIKSVGLLNINGVDSGSMLSRRIWPNYNVILTGQTMMCKKRAAAYTIDPYYLSSVCRRACRD